MKSRTENPDANLSNRPKGVIFFLKQGLEPPVLFFGILLTYCLLMFINALQAMRNPFVFSKWNLVTGLMFVPLLLLIGSVLILIRRLSTVAFAIAIALYIVYVTGLRFLLATPYSHGVPIVSFDALRIWFTATPNNLIVQTAFASVALIVGTVQLCRLLRVRRKRSSEFLKQ